MARRRMTMKSAATVRRAVNRLSDLSIEEALRGAQVSVISSEFSLERRAYLIPPLLELLEPLFSGADRL